MAKRKISGVLLLDKPAGMSSNLALQKAKRLLQAEKAGHTGTLDPFATGLLPLCLGEATKFSQFLLDSDKVYLAVVQLGVRTSTADPEGDILETRPVTVKSDDVKRALPRFLGNILQLPPMHSAIKKDGRPLYDYARKGIEIAREPRPVVIHDIELVGMADTRVTLRVHCGKGVYVRTLAEDLGDVLGCGAYLLELRREKVGPFSLVDGVALDELAGMDAFERDDCLLPADCLVDDLPLLDLDLEAAWQLQHGQAIWMPRLKVGETMRAYGPDGGFLGIVNVDFEGKAAPKRLVASP